MGYISLFGQAALIFSSVWSEIFVDQSDTKEHKLRRSDIFRAHTRQMSPRCFIPQRGRCSVERSRYGAAQEPRPSTAMAAGRRHARKRISILLASPVVLRSQGLQKLVDAPVVSDYQCLLTNLRHYAIFNPISLRYFAEADGFCPAPPRKKGNEMTARVRPVARPEWSGTATRERFYPNPAMPLPSLNCAQSCQNQGKSSQKGTLTLETPLTGPSLCLV